MTLLGKDAFVAAALRQLVELLGKSVVEQYSALIMVGAIVDGTEDASADLARVLQVVAELYLKSPAKPVRVQACRALDKSYQMVPGSLPPQTTALLLQTALQSLAAEEDLMVVSSRLVVNIVANVDASVLSPQHFQMLQAAVFGCLEKAADPRRAMHLLDTLLQLVRSKNLPEPLVSASYAYTVKNRDTYVKTRDDKLVGDPDACELRAAAAPREHQPERADHADRRVPAEPVDVRQRAGGA